MPASPTGAPAHTPYAPAADQSTVRHLRLAVLSVAPLQPHGLRLHVRSGDVGFAVNMPHPGAPHIQAGDALVMEYRKEDNPLTCLPTALYPDTPTPAPQKEQPVNPIAIASHLIPVTMTSLELVDFINGQRKEGESELRHDHFMAKVPKVLGEDHAPKFRDMIDVTVGKGATRQSPIYRFPKRESCLMAMSYSYELQAKVYDYMTELERMVDQPKIPQTMPEALRLAADLAEQRDQLILENKAQAAALDEALPKAQGFELITAGEKSITMREAAKLLSIKENRLTTWMHEHGWIYRLNGRWVAKQEHIQGGRLIYKEARYTDEKTGHEVYAPYCHITPKGLDKLARAFGSDLEQQAA